MSLTRRQFLMSVGRIGGYGAAYALMQSLGLLPIPEAAADSRLRLIDDRGSRVVILGGGIAGLVTAHELGKAGWSCTLLESLHCPGGRNWSIRNGPVVEFADGMRQTCAWATPARPVCCQRTGTQVYGSSRSKLFRIIRPVMYQQGID